MNYLPAFGLALVAAVAIAASAYITVQKLKAGNDSEEADTCMLIIAAAAMVAALMVSPGCSDDKTPSPAAKKVQA